MEQPHRVSPVVLETVGTAIRDDKQWNCLATRLFSLPWDNGRGSADNAIPPYPCMWKTLLTIIQTPSSFTMFK